MITFKTQVLSPSGLTFNILHSCQYITLQIKFLLCGGQCVAEWPLRFEDRRQYRSSLGVLWLQGWMIKLVTCGNILISWYPFRKQFFLSETLCQGILFRISSPPSRARHSYQQLKWRYNNEKKQYRAIVILELWNVKRKITNVIYVVLFFERL